MWKRALQGARGLAEAVSAPAEKTLPKTATNARERLKWMIASQKDAMEKYNTSNTKQIHEVVDPPIEPKITKPISPSSHTTDPLESMNSNTVSSKEESNLTKLYGIGRKREETFHHHHIFTIAQLSQLTDSQCESLKQIITPIFLLRKRAQKFQPKE